MPDNHRSSESSVPVECRSALYMPATNPKALAKGPILDADVIVVDLEDSVAPSQKDLAREQAVNALTDQDYAFRTRALRINTSNTPWFTEDVKAAARCAPDVLVLPKVETTNDIATLSQAMDAYASLCSCSIWAMIESPLGVVNATSIAQSKAHYPRLRMFIVGNNDLARASGMAVEAPRQYLLPWIMSVVLAAKAYGLQVLDGVYNDFRDAEGFDAECAQGARMGIDGKTLIHPSQIDSANKLFSPSESELSAAQAIVEAFSLPENADKGAISIDGRMTERLHLGMAETLLKRAENIAQR